MTRTLGFCPYRITILRVKHSFAGHQMLFQLYCMSWVQKLIHSWLLIWTFLKLSRNAKDISYLSIKFCNWTWKLSVRSKSKTGSDRFLNIFVTNFQNRRLTEIKENQRGTENDSHLYRREVYVVGEKTLKKKPTLYFHFLPSLKSTEMSGKIWPN